MCTTSSWINFTKFDIKVEEEDKAFLLLILLLDSYNLMMILLFGKDIVSLEEVTTSLLSNKIWKKPNIEGG